MQMIRTVVAVEQNGFLMLLALLELLNGDVLLFLQLLVKILVVLAVHVDEGSFLTGIRHLTQTAARSL